VRLNQIQVKTLLTSFTHKSYYTTRPLKLKRQTSNFDLFLFKHSFLTGAFEKENMVEFLDDLSSVKTNKRDQFFSICISYLNIFPDRVGSITRHAGIVGGMVRPEYSQLQG